MKPTLDYAHPDVDAPLREDEIPPVACIAVALLAFPFVLPLILFLL
jgi:hypothetical protein